MHAPTTHMRTQGCNKSNLPPRAHTRRAAAQGLSRVWARQWRCQRCGQHKTTHADGEGHARAISARTTLPAISKAQERIAQQLANGLAAAHQVPDQLPAGAAKLVQQRVRACPLGLVCAVPPASGVRRIAQVCRQRAAYKTVASRCNLRVKPHEKCGDKQRTAASMSRLYTAYTP